MFQNSNLVLSPDGDLVEAEIMTVPAQIKKALLKHGRCEGVILEMGKVQRIDALGVNLIAGLYKQCEKDQCAFHIRGVLPETTKILKYFKLNSAVVDGDSPTK